MTQTMIDMVIVKSIKTPSRFGICKTDFIQFSQPCIKHSVQYCLFTWKGNFKNRSQLLTEDTNCQENYKHSRSSRKDFGNETTLLRRIPQEGFSAHSSPVTHFLCGLVCGFVSHLNSQWFDEQQPLLDFPCEMDCQVTGPDDMGMWSIPLYSWP